LIDELYLISNAINKHIKKRSELNQEQRKETLDRRAAGKEERNDEKGLSPYRDCAEERPKKGNETG
jgi:hypothetical protein